MRYMHLPLPLRDPYHPSCSLIPIAWTPEDSGILRLPELYLHLPPFVQSPLLLSSPLPQGVEGMPRFPFLLMVLSVSISFFLLGSICLLIFSTTSLECVFLFVSLAELSSSPICSFHGYLVCPRMSMGFLAALTE